MVLYTGLALGRPQGRTLSQCHDIVVYIMTGNQLHSETPRLDADTLFPVSYSTYSLRSVGTV